MFTNNNKPRALGLDDASSFSHAVPLYFNPFGRSQNSKNDDLAAALRRLPLPLRLPQIAR